MVLDSLDDSWLTAAAQASDIELDLALYDNQSWHYPK
jgi:hypothetical protein